MNSCIVLTRFLPLPFSLSPLPLSPPSPSPPLSLLPPLSPQMLSESIMHECIVRLLRSTSDEEALECFSRLITTTGKELDHPQAKVRARII